MFGRVDTAKFHIGLSTARNVFISYRGGAYSRAGTAFVGFSKQTGRTYPPRVITFQFSINQGLTLEFGNLYMRVISSGAFITEAPQTITGISGSNPAVVNSSAHGFFNNDWVFISNVVGMTQVNGQTYVVQNATINDFSLADVYGNPIDSSAFGAYVSGGTAARIYTLVTPYSEVDIAFLKFTQSADVMSLTCWNQDTGTSYPPYDLSRLANNSWTLTPFQTGAKIAAPATASGSSSGAGGTDFQYVVTAFDSASGEESVASPIADIPNSVDIALTAGSINVTWAPVPSAGYYHVYKAPPAYAGDVPVGSLFGYAGTSYGNNFVDSNITADLAEVPPLHKDPFSPGQALSVVITNPGSGLTAVSYLIGTSSGSGAHGYGVIVGGQMTAFIFDSNGGLYLPGDTITFTAGAFAFGDISFGANPTAADTITLNGLTWTFVAAITGPDQTVIQGTLAATLIQLAADLSSSLDPALTVAQYSPTATVIDITFKTPGVSGNAYALAASAATPSAGTLTGGAGAGGTAPVGTLVLGPQAGTYPSVVAYYQERLVYAATPNNPDTYFMSQPGVFKNFDSRIPTVDSDAIIGTPWSVEVNGIQFMVPMPGGLVVLTGLQAWQLTGTGGSSLNPQPITPSNQQAQPQAYNGCHSHVPPIKIDYDINYVQAKGSILRDLSYNFFVNIYTGVDLTYLSSQLFTGYSINEMAWCEEPYKIIWTARNDGNFLSLTYLKAQDVTAWTRHDTQGQVWSVCSVTEPPVDALYLGTQRYPGGQNAYMIERMNNRIWDDVEDCWCVDAALELPQDMPVGTLTASSATGAGIPIGVMGLVGGESYSPGTTASIVDPTGLGVAITLTIVAGVITDVSFVGGTNYSYPQLNFNDPAGAGSGAEAVVVLDNSAEFTSSVPAFSAGSFGNVIRMGGGIATITSFIDVQHVTANITSPIVRVIPNTSPAVPIPQTNPSDEFTDSGWTVSAPVTTISGLNHLIGATVTGLADGNVITPRVVSPTGTITLDQPASNVVVGLGFQAQVQSLYVDAGQPTLQGRRKKVAAATVRLEASRGLKVGSNQPDGSTLSPLQNAPRWTNLMPAEDLAKPVYGSTVIPLYTGDTRVPLNSAFDKPGQVAIQQDYPLPMQILAIIPEILPGDLPETEAQDRRPQQQGRRAA